MPNDKNDPFAHVASFEELHEIDKLCLLCLPFTDQQWYHHLVLVGGGIALWLGTYVGVLELFDWWAVAMTDTTDGLLLRQRSAMIANVLFGVYFAMAWLRGYGGVFLSFIIYPAFLFVITLTRILPNFLSPPADELTTVTVLRGPATWTSEIVPLAVTLVIPLVIIPLGAILICDLCGEWGDRKFARHLSHWPPVHIRVMFGDLREEDDPHLQAAFSDVGVNLDEIAPDDKERSHPDRIIETPAGDQSMNALIILVAISLLFLGNYAIIVFLAIGTYLHRQYRRAAIRECAIN